MNEVSIQKGCRQLFTITHTPAHQDRKTNKRSRRKADVDEPRTNGPKKGVKRQMCVREQMSVGKDGVIVVEKGIDGSMGSTGKHFVKSS